MLRLPVLTLPISGSRRLDDYVVQSTATVNFRVGSSVLSPEAKAQLDQIAQAAQGLKGYSIEVTGFASSAMVAS